MFLLLLYLPVVYGSFMCYQCATDSAIMNWSKFRLPMQQGDSMVGDNSCYFEEKVQSHVPCNGVCVTANVTNETGHVVAVVRDCQYLSPKKREELETADDNCITKEVVLRRKVSMSISYNTYYSTLENERGGKNVFTNVGTEKIKRRPSQVDRAIHRLYSEPRQVFSNRLVDQLFKRTYWALRGVQFRIFYKNEELDTEEVLENWELGVKPPPLEELTKVSHFDPRWLKYMYGRFKNECPSGRMKEPEFKTLLESVLPHKKGTDQYINRLFRAFSDEEHNSVTFQNLIECLSLLHPETAESRAKWTVKLITGSTSTHFTYPEFLSFTKSVFALNNNNEDSNGFSPMHRESASQRAEAIFRELDRNGDGLVTEEDMVRFYMEEMQRLDDNSSTCSSCYRTPMRMFPDYHEQ